MSIAEHPRSLLHTVTLWWRARRCTYPACGHVLGRRFPAPRHLTGPRCRAISWWTGCIAWMAGHCICPGCTPIQVAGPGTGGGCSCPADLSAALI